MSCRAFNARHAAPTAAASGGRLPGSSRTALGRLAEQVGLRPGESGVHGMPGAEHALQARLEFMHRARQSMDMQTDLIGNDQIGRIVPRALRDAASTGVRVRLLLDDFYTLDIDGPLLQLAAPVAN